MNTSVHPPFRYSYEEFSDHMRAMITVRQWHYTQRFGDLGPAQDSRSNTARVVEYFSDSYADSKEAVAKAELFLSIHDYLARHASFFSKKGLLEQAGEGLLTADPELLRAVHFVFSLGVAPGQVDARKLVRLARCFQDLVPPL